MKMRRSRFANQIDTISEWCSKYMRPRHGIPTQLNLKVSEIKVRYRAEELCSSEVQPRERSDRHLVRKNSNLLVGSNGTFKVVQRL